MACNMFISTHEEMNPSHRSTMEDCHVYYKSNELDFGNSVDMQLLGVYDGHGGREIVDFLEKNLGKNIAQEVKYNDASSIGEKLERAFIITDVESRMDGILYSGATVVVCLIQRHHDGDDCDYSDGSTISNNDRTKSKRNFGKGFRSYTIYTANCGDARAVLSTKAKVDESRKKSKSTSPSDQLSISSLDHRNDNVVRLSTDDRADNPSEKERIESSGGQVIRNRVLGVLAVSRSLGDHQFKEFVIGRPHTHEIRVDVEEENDTFLILACDGLWDVFQDEEAVDLVKQHTSDLSVLGDKLDDRKKETVAKVLVDEAIKRGSTDNITCVVAWL